MAALNRVHGQVAAGAFYGYTPLVIKIADSGSRFTADSVNGTTGAITEGGYALAVKAIQSLGSIVWLGAQLDASITVIVDQPTFNAGAGATTSGAYGALKDAMVGAGILSAANVVSGNLTVTTSSVLNGAGTFTFA